MRTETKGLVLGGLVVLQLFIASCSSPEPPPTNTPASAPETSTAEPGESVVAGTPSTEVIAEALPYAEIDEELVYGHFAIPADMIDPLPAIIVVHDWWGLNDDVRDTAERLAADGYIVLAVDLFLGETADGPAAARDLEIGIVENPRLAADNLDQAVEFIRASSGAPSVSIVGFGFGGNWAFNMALDHPDALSSAVSYYGQVRTRDEDLTRLDVPFLGFFLESDRAVPIKTAREFELRANALDKDVDVQILQQGRRGFLERSSNNYDASVTGEAWRHMLGFLQSRLNETTNP